MPNQEILDQARYHEYERGKSLSLALTMLREEGGGRREEGGGRREERGERREEIGRTSE